VKEQAEERLFLSSPRSGIYLQLCEHGCLPAWRAYGRLIDTVLAQAVGIANPNASKPEPRANTNVAQRQQAY
jgi:hypothetical protein